MLSVSSAETGVSCGFREWRSVPVGREYIRIIREREHVIRYSAEETRERAVIDSVSYNQRGVIRGKSYALYADGFGVKWGVGYEDVFAEGGG